MTETGKLVYILDDDQAFAKLLARTFEEHGFVAETFGLIRNFERRVAQQTPALCLVDMRLPDGGGLDVAVRRPGGGRIPVIFISGVMTDLADKVLGLEMGADDYLIKPFSPREAVARARAVLRRMGAGQDRKPDIAVFAGWSADFASHTLHAPDGTVSELSASEVKLLHSLVSAPHRVLSRAALVGEDGGEARAYDRSIDVRVSRLRHKLGEDPRNPRIIKTIFGSGYMFTATVDWVDHLPEG